MPIRGGSPPPQGGGKKKFSSRSPPPEWQASDEGGRVPSRSKERGRRKRKGDRKSVVTPLELPSRQREERDRDVTPRATHWDDESDTEDEAAGRQPGRHRGGKGPQSGRRAGRSDLGAGAAEQWQEAARWKKKESKRKKRGAPKQETRQKEDDERRAQAVFQQACAMHEAALMDEEHRRRFHSHQMVFTLGALLFLLPLASLSVFTGALILAFPILGMLYGIVCAAAAWCVYR